MEPVIHHSWNLSYAQAASLQTELSAKVRARGNAARARRIAGVDVAISPDKRQLVAAVVVLDKHLHTIERRFAVAETKFPYVPGYLSFREGPVVMAALAKLQEPADLLIFDGQGWAHPRRLGLASHIGLLINTPSIGAAKSRLIGEHGRLGLRKGAVTPLLDGGEQIGTVVRTRRAVRPIYVSVGHRISLDAAVKWVLRCSPQYRVPEPTRSADHWVGELKKAQFA